MFQNKVLDVDGMKVKLQVRQLGEGGLKVGDTQETVGSPDCWPIPVTADLGHGWPGEVPQCHPCLLS